MLAAIMLAAIMLALKGRQGFLLLYGTAVAAMFFVWTTILVTNIGFRRTLSPERLRALPVKMPVHPISSVVGIIVILALAASMPFVEGLEWDRAALSRVAGGDDVPVFLAKEVKVKVRDDEASSRACQAHALPRPMLQKFLA